MLVVWGAVVSEIELIGGKFRTYTTQTQLDFVGSTFKKTSFFFVDNLKGKT